jgi:hypothetical protein
MGLFIPKSEIREHKETTYEKYSSWNEEKESTSPSKKDRSIEKNSTTKYDTRIVENTKIILIFLFPKVGASNNTEGKKENIKKWWDEGCFGQEWKKRVSVKEKYWNDRKRKCHIIWEPYMDGKEKYDSNNNSCNVRKVPECINKESYNWEYHDAECENAGFDGELAKWGYPWDNLKNTEWCESNNHQKERKWTNHSEVYEAIIDEKYYRCQKHLEKKWWFFFGCPEEEISE